MSVASLGRVTFEDLYAPAKGKSEWGMDTLTRRMSGARVGLDTFIATLAQGDLYQGYYLQTWEPDDNPDVAVVTLNYKGLITGGTPVSDPITQISPAKGSISKSYADEGSGRFAGIGRIYKKIALYALNPDPLFNDEDQPFGFRNVYTTGVTMEFTYDAIQTVYRYITVGKPDRPKYYTVDIQRIPTVKEARYTTADGSVYGSNAPIELTIDLIPAVITSVVGFSSKNVIGSPYYECEDVVRRELGEYDSSGAGSFGGG